MNRILLAWVLVLGACAAERRSGGLSDDQFIDTMVDLRRVGLSAGSDTARFEAARDSILARRGVTERELRAYIDAHGSDLDRLAAVWDSVSVRLTRRISQ